MRMQAPTAAAPPAPLPGSTELTGAAVPGSSRSGCLPAGWLPCCWQPWPSTLRWGRPTAGGGSSGAAEWQPQREQQQQQQQQWRAACPRRQCRPPTHRHQASGDDQWSHVRASAHCTVYSLPLVPQCCSLCACVFQPRVFARTPVPTATLYCPVWLPCLPSSPACSPAAAACAAALLRDSAAQPATGALQRPCRLVPTGGVLPARLLLRAGACYPQDCCMALSCRCC